MRSTTVNSSAPRSSWKSEKVHLHPAALKLLADDLQPAIFDVPPQGGDADPSLPAGARPSDVSARPDLGLFGRDGGGQAQLLAGGDRLVRVDAGERRVVGGVERVGVGGVRGLLPVAGRLRQRRTERADLGAVDAVQALDVGLESGRDSLGLRLVPGQVGLDGVLLGLVRPQGLVDRVRPLEVRELLGLEGVRGVQRAVQRALRGGVGAAHRAVARRPALRGRGVVEELGALGERPGVRGVLLRLERAAGVRDRRDTVVAGVLIALVDFEFAHDLAFVRLVAGHDLDGVRRPLGLAGRVVAVTGVQREHRALAGHLLRAVLGAVDGVGDVRAPHRADREQGGNGGYAAKGTIGGTDSHDVYILLLDLYMGYADRMPSLRPAVAQCLEGRPSPHRGVRLGTSREGCTARSRRHRPGQPIAPLASSAACWPSTV
ncbi:hypothetical protein SAM23877_0058 [Streptomyces ambofaciens ATCC 23877]|uniref:Uncharacterized protein n=1 Tax=Streptomyces ambofaciens (strain ATCC 23877 / 3486 / DSM 40053 / JCM 4204 / NBRC 12836 / NRRL B-2516) TaxID=278992 RepID=A0A0K2AJT4_STRA7|nr:hypothetical protein SAM23877_0058 [Streptomyces ambofaciens ATCC 23877]